MTDLRSIEVVDIAAQRINTRPYITSIEELNDHFSEGNGSFEGYLPAGIVERDAHLPFKKERTEELVEDLKTTRERDGWGNGQDSPMLAAYITGEQVPSVQVYDGLHRQDANVTFQSRYGIEIDRPASVLAAIGMQAIHFVTVKPMTRRDMLDKRLVNTRNHPELRFARGGLWSSQLWYLDDISKLAPTISPKQAFNLAERTRSDAHRIGNRLGLSEAVVEQITIWATERADAWSVDPSTVYKWIHRAESTSPEVIARVRTLTKGKAARGEVTEGTITALTNFLPGAEYADTHTALINYSISHELSPGQFSHLLARIVQSSRVKDPSDVSQIVDFLDLFDAATLTDHSTARTVRRLRPRTDIFAAGAGAIASVGDAIDRVAESLEVRGEREAFIPDEAQREAAKAAADELEQQADRALRLAAEARLRATRSTATAAPKPTLPNMTVNMPTIRETKYDIPEIEGVHITEEDKQDLEEVTGDQFDGFVRRVFDLANYPGTPTDDEVTQLVDEFNKYQAVAKGLRIIQPTLYALFRRMRVGE